MLSDTAKCLLSIPDSIFINYSMSEISVQLGLHENDLKDEPFTMHLVIEEEQDENGRYAAAVLDEFRDEIITLKHDQVPKLISKVADTRETLAPKGRHMPGCCNGQPASPRVRDSHNLSSRVRRLAIVGEMWYLIPYLP